MAWRPKTERCWDCGAEIYWGVTTSKGTPMPVDAKPVENGNILLSVCQKDRLVGGKHCAAGVVIVHVLKKDDEPGPGRNKYQSHFVSCPAASKFRKKGKAR